MRMLHRLITKLTGAIYASNPVLPYEYRNQPGTPREFAYPASHVEHQSQLFPCQQHGRQTNPTCAADTHHIGGQRENRSMHETNQDTTLTDGFRLSNGRSATLLVVADGIGGQRKATYASNIATSIVHQAVARACVAAVIDHATDWLALLEKACWEASSALFYTGHYQPLWRGMGSTLTIGLIVGTTLFLAHVGDSRMYVINQSGMTQLTCDHTLAQRLISRGTYQPGDPALPEYQHLYQKIGDRSIHVQCRQLDLGMSDRIIVCTNGLTKHVSDSEILAQAQKQLNAQALAEQLVQIACERGGDNNIGVITLFCDSPTPIAYEQSFHQAIHS
jgi:protein phosphatase